MDLKKKDKKTPYLTLKGKLIFSSALISGIISYLFMCLRIFGEFSNKMNSFLVANFTILGILFLFLFCYIIASLLTGDMDDLINKK